MSNQTYLGHLATASAITITTTEGILTIPSSHVSYTAALMAIKLGDFDEAMRLADTAKSINEFGQGQVYVQGGVVFWNGKELHNSLTKRISRMIAEGFDVTPMVKFLEKLMTNPSGRAIQELYRFLESNNLPITPDGYFLAYKNVNENYKDRHSNTFDNSIGAVCEMPRNEVMDDPNRTCSAGLHFCSIEYLKGFWGTSGHTMVVKINPCDVVSIPVDYNNSKGRCCRYTVIAEHMHKTEDTLSTKSVYSEPLSAYDAGCKAYRDGSDENPYDTFDYRYDDWEEGFEDTANEWIEF
jgi:hypothetical protein